MKYFRIFLLLALIYDGNITAKSSGNNSSNKADIFSFALGAGYGIEYIKTTQNRAYTLSHKYSIILSNKWNLSSFFIEMPLSLSYIIPDSSYFKNYFNNVGDGAGVNIAILFGKDFNLSKARIALNGGIGYSASSLFAMRDRLDNTQKVSDIGYGIYHGAEIRLGGEFAFGSVGKVARKHSFGFYISYYPLLWESLRLFSADTTNVYSVNSTNFKGQNSTSLSASVYYLYRF